jgi:hypothetical protein
MGQSVAVREPQYAASWLRGVSELQMHLSPR